MNRKLFKLHLEYYNTVLHTRNAPFRNLQKSIIIDKNYIAFFIERFTYTA